VGKPADFSTDDSAEEAGQRSSQQKTKAGRKKFFRNPDDKMIGGVCSGISAYFGWDVLLVRIAFIVMLFATWFWMVPAYLLCWLLAAEAHTAEEKLQMRGEAITIENIGKTVAEEKRPGNTKNTGLLSDLVRIAGGFLKFCFVVLTLLICIPLVFAIVVLVIILFSVLLGLGGGLAGMIPSGFLDIPGLLTLSHSMTASLTFILVLLIPLIVLSYGIIAYVAKWKPVHPGIKWTGFVIWLAALILFLCSGGFWRTGIYSVENDVPSEKEYRLPPITAVSLEDDLIAHLEIEQMAGSKTDSIVLQMSGNEDMLRKVQYRIKENELCLFAYDKRHFKSGDGLRIHIKTPFVESIKMKSVGKISIRKPFVASRLKIGMKGAGKLQADNLAVDYLKVDSEGVGSIHLKGRARVAKFDLEGAGKINAYGLQADTVYAAVNGVGSIRVFPTEYLKTQINGVGKITYKEEPKRKDTNVFGLGTWEKE
jgi:phage shock protein PspC (stress-responsive transcriptional regulator)